MKMLEILLAAIVVILCIGFGWNGLILENVRNDVRTLTDILVENGHEGHKS